MSVRNKTSEQFCMAWHCMVCHMYNHRRCRTLSWQWKLNAISPSVVPKNSGPKNDVENLFQAKISCAPVTTIEKYHILKLSTSTVQKMLRCWFLRRNMHNKKSDPIKLSAGTEANREVSIWHSRYTISSNYWCYLLSFRFGLPVAPILLSFFSSALHNFRMVI